VDKKERIKRPTPERTQPIRSWATLFGAATPGDGEAVPGDAPRPGFEDVVARSVDLGYRVIDEYIRQGQKAAQRFRDRSYGPETMTNDAQELGSRMARYASDFTALWFEFMQATVAGATAAPAARAAAPPAGAGAPAAAAAVGRAPTQAETDGGEGTRVRIAVSSVRPAEVSLELRPQAAGRPLVVQALRAVDPEKPRLGDVSLEPAGADAPMTLRVRVAADQPPGVYNGVIVDGETSQLMGTVSLRLGE
jgi:hypothetical protein